MDIEYSSHFKRAYQKLSPELQRKAERAERLFWWSFSIDYHYRIAFAFVKNKKSVVFLDVGDHDIYR